MDIVLLLVAMVVVGLVIGGLAGAIWKRDRPFGLGGDLAIAVVAAVAIGLIDWFVIPAMGFSVGVKLLGVATEPILGALLVLWLVRRARR